MEYSQKRKIQTIKEGVFIRIKQLNNIDELISSDILSCEINGSNNTTFYKPHAHTSSRKQLIKEILLADKELINKEIEELQKKLEELTMGDIYDNETEC